jgi:hypothetical protein
MQGKKPGTETASIDAYYFRNLPKIHVDAAQVPVQSGMHGSPVGVLLILTKRFGQTVWLKISGYAFDNYTKESSMLNYYSPMVTQKRA